MNNLNIKKFPDEFNILPNNSDGEYLIISRKGDKKPFKISIERLSALLGVAAGDIQRIEAVEAGPLPTPDEPNRYMVVTNVGAYTYGGTTIGTNDDGYQTTFWWNGTAWSNNGSVRIKGDPAIPDGEVVEGDERAVSGDKVNEKFNYPELYNRMDLPKPFQDITLINILNNNNMVSVWGGVAKTNVLLENNEFTFIFSAPTNRVEANFNKIEGHKYYMKIDVKSDSNQVYMQTPSISTTKYHSGNGDWETLSFIFFSETSVANSSLRVRDARTSGWTNISIRKGLVVDLTAVYGSGNEPDLETFEALLSELDYMWFNPTYTYFDKNINNNKTFFIENGEVVFKEVSNNLFLGKTIAFFGSSTTEFGDWVDQVGRKTGANVLKFGFGGTRLVDMEGSIPNYDDISLIALTKAIMSDDWSKPDIAIANLKDLGDDNEAQYNLLKDTNFNSIDYVFIMYATNDFRTGNLRLGDLTDTNTYRNFTASFKYIIEQFNTNYPKAQLILAAPIIRLGDNPGESSDDLIGASGSYLYEFAYRIGEIAKMYHFPFLDLYNNSGINKLNGLHYIADGTHPNQTGYDLIARKVINFLNSN